MVSDPLKSVTTTPITSVIDVRDVGGLGPNGMPSQLVSRAGQLSAGGINCSQCEKEQLGEAAKLLGDCGIPGESFAQISVVRAKLYTSVLASCCVVAFKSSSTVSVMYLTCACQFPEHSMRDHVRNARGNFLRKQPATTVNM